MVAARFAGTETGLQTAQVHQDAHALGI